LFLLSHWPCIIVRVRRDKKKTKTQHNTTKHKTTMDQGAQGGFRRGIGPVRTATPSETSSADAPLSTAVAGTDVLTQPPPPQSQPGPQPPQSQPPSPAILSSSFTQNERLTALDTVDRSVLASATVASLESNTPLNTATSGQSTLNITSLLNPSVLVSSKLSETLHSSNGSMSESSAVSDAAGGSGIPLGIIIAVANGMCGIFFFS
jgi:hypothetical protein